MSFVREEEEGWGGGGGGMINYAILRGQHFFCTWNGVSPKLVGQNKNALALPPSNFLPVPKSRTTLSGICVFAIRLMKAVVGVFHLQKNPENFHWEFPFGKSAFHLSQVPFVHRPLYVA